jgi:hypothetical protein
MASWIRGAISRWTCRWVLMMKSVLHDLENVHRKFGKSTCEIWKICLFNLENCHAKRGKTDAEITLSHVVFVENVAPPAFLK